MDLFNKGQVEELEKEVANLRQQIQGLGKYGAMNAVQVEQEIVGLQKNKQNLEASLADLAAQLQTTRAELVETQELAMLQEVGIYEFSEILDNAVAYQDKIKEIEEKVKAANKKDCVHA